MPVNYSFYFSFKNLLLPPNFNQIFQTFTDTEMVMKNQNQKQRLKYSKIWVVKMEMFYQMLAIWSKAPQVMYLVKDLAALVALENSEVVAGFKGKKKNISLCISTPCSALALALQLNYSPFLSKYIYLIIKDNKKKKTNKKLYSLYLFENKKKTAYSKKYNILNNKKKTKQHQSQANKQQYCYLF